MRIADPQSIAIAVVRHRDQVLIARRPEGKPLAGMWEFPGGKVLKGENPSLAAARECLEETGLEVRISPPYDEVLYPYEHGTLRLHFFIATPVDPARSPRPPFRWVAVAELGNYPFPPANASILAKLLQEISRCGNDEASQVN
jgi:8-oxo-dGTP diphosphatase